MFVARTSALSIAAVLLLAGCSSNGLSGTGGGATTTTTTTKTTTTASTTTTSSTTTTTTTAPPCPGIPNCTSPVCPPILQTLVAAKPGLTLTWSEPTACDTVEIEFQFGLVPYPSEQNPPQPPNFTVAKPAMTYTDKNATMSNMYTYRARCVAAGVDSCWSNELAAPGSTM